MKSTESHLELARSLFREANDAFFVFDPRTRIIIDLNPAAQRLTGLEKHAARSLRLGEIFSSAVPDGLERLIQALDRTGFFHSREGYSLQRPSKGPLPVNLSVSRIHTQPEPVGLIVARDISERVRAEEALRQAETRYRSLIASTGVIVWEIDGDGVLRSISPAFREITGWPPGDWVGRRLDDLLAPDGRDAAIGMRRRAWQGESVPRYEFRIRRDDGGILDCESLLVSRIPEGPADRLLEVVRDITEAKRTALALEQSQALRLAKEAAERENRAKSEFLSGVSHEIRTPLTAIVGFLDLLAEHPHSRSGPAEFAGHLEVIRQNGRFLLAMVDDLLDISRIESGQLHVERGPCAPLEVAEDVVGSLRPAAEARALRLELDSAGDVARSIVTDRLRLRQILAHLLDNAIRFTEDGTVRLAVRAIDRPDRGRSLRFEVSDTGIGMTSVEVSRAFEPFYRARPAAPGGAGGAGLGLAICERLARRLGGEITAESVPRQGSVFTLILPAGSPGERDASAQAADPRRPTPRAAAARPQPRIDARILVADDNEANRELIGIRLHQAGAEVVTASDGQEALDRAREADAAGRPFDAVIMDMHMPVLDGYEAVRHLRAGGFTDPIMAVTAYAMSEDREECLRLGCDEFVSKPIEWDRFFAKLTGLLGARRIARREGA